MTFSIRQCWRNAAATEDCREDAHKLDLGHLLAWAHSGASRPREKGSLGWNNQILVSDCRAFRNPPRRLKFEGVRTPVFRIRVQCGIVDVNLGVCRYVISFRTTRDHLVRVDLPADMLDWSVYS